jgi:hypothetical protein
MKKQQLYANDSDFGFGGSIFTKDIERENELQIKLILEWYLSITDMDTN